MNENENSNHIIIFARQYLELNIGVHLASLTHFSIMSFKFFMVAGFSKKSLIPHWIYFYSSSSLSLELE